jgi:hypothetical protein
MPFAGPPGRPPTLLESVVPLLHAGFHPLGAGIAQIVTLPGQAVISFLLVVAAAWKLRNVTGARCGWPRWPSSSSSAIR